jgi:hypothetical protein
MRNAPLQLCTCIFLAALIGCGSDAKKVGEADKPAAEKPATSAAEKPAAPAAEEIHFDITIDQSGVLARTASVLETSEALSSPALRDHLAELSHHAEKTPSNEVLCKHMTDLMGDKAPEAHDCAEALEHQRVHLGPEVFGLVAGCVTSAKTLEALMRCEDAEKEAEKLLHERKNGSNLSDAVCLKMFVHFETLAMADAGDQGKVVEEILEEVRADVLLACKEHGTQAEFDCAMAAKDMAALGLCTSTIL